MASSREVLAPRSFVRRLTAAWGPTVASAALSTALACGVAGAIVFSGHPAAAESAYESAYGFDRTWNAALRMIRVDMGCKVLEKDDRSGYLMFEYHSAEGGKKVSSGSMEFIRPREQDGAVRIVVQLPQMPRYHEQVLIDTLVRKMRAEYGDPPQARPKPPVEPAPAAPPAPKDARDGGVAVEAGDTF
jgi:hypothetical protein